MRRLWVSSFVLAAVTSAMLVGAPMSQAPAPAPARFEVPKPTGPFPVGTTSFHVIDEAHTETFADAPEKRQIQVVAWYPAADSAGGEPAPYLRSGPSEVRTFATLLRQPDNAFSYLEAARSAAMLDAPPRPGDALPVLLFSHGYTAIASSYASLLEDLASHGYAVLSIVHPYESMAATLADGRVVTMLDGQKQMRQGIRDVLGEWGKEDETMAAVAAAADEASALTLMRGYLGSIPLTTTALKRWVNDTVLALDRIAMLPAGAPQRLAARLDLTRVGAFGHSMGGVTSADFCARDRRCHAALNLDGIPQYGTLVDSTAARPFLMVYSGRTGRLGASDVIYRRATRPYLRVDVADTLHNDFSDMVLWGGPLAGRPMFGKLPAERAVAITRQIVREYFDQELRGRRSPLLSGSAPVPGVRVH